MSNGQGERKLLKNSLEDYFPEEFGTYYEPFLGGGAVFLHLVGMGLKFDAVLSDTNAELLTTYRVLKDQVEDLLEGLREHERKYKAEPEKYFYDVRASEPITDLEKANAQYF